MPFAETLIERLVYVSRNPARLDRMLDEQLAFAQSNTLELPRHCPAYEGPQPAEA